jgi:hypothetical protein
MTTRTLPVFYLRGVNIQSVWEKYMSGAWSNPTVVPKINPPTGIAPKELVANPAIPDYTLRDNYNSTLVFTTTNTTVFEAFDREGINMAPRHFKCQRCKREVEGVPMGYPLHHENKVVVVFENGRHINKYVQCFWTQGEYHSFECIMGDVMEMSGRIGLLEHNHIFELLCSMFAIMYPEKWLHASPDGRLLVSQGGTLSEDEYGEPTHIYKPTHRMILAPLKLEHVRRVYPHAVEFYRPDTRKTTATQVTATTDA